MPFCSSHTVYHTYHFSSAPRRRSQGTDVVLVPPTTAKLPVATTASTATAVTSTSVVPSSSETTSASSTAKDPDSDDLPANPVNLGLVLLQHEHNIYMMRMLVYRFLLCLL